MNQYTYYAQVAQQTLRKIKQLLPKEELVAVYLKGSYVRKELIPESDIDIVVILKHIRYAKKIEKLSNYAPKSGVASKNIIQIGCYSLYSLKTGRNSKQFRHTPVGRINWNWEHFEKIYGKDITKEKLFRRDPKELYDSYKKFLFHFSEKFREQGIGGLAKATLWLGWCELLYKKGLNFYSFKKIASYYPKGHVIQKALVYRNKRPPKESPLRKQFVKEVKEYCKK